MAPKLPPPIEVSPCKPSGASLGDESSTTPPSLRPYSAGYPAVRTRMDSTSCDSKFGAKAGDRFSFRGTPSTTNWTSYSDPRGCSTPFASYSHPGWALIRSSRPRPGCDPKLSAIDCLPIEFTVEVRLGSTNVAESVTSTLVWICATPSVTATCTGTSEPTRTTWVNV